jgi:hypothetical protein
MSRGKSLKKKSISWIVLDIRTAGDRQVLEEERRDMSGREIRICPPYQDTSSGFSLRQEIAAMF